MIVNENECRAAGLDPAEVTRIARGLERYAKQAQAMGVQIFGGAAGGQLRFAEGRRGDLILAHLGGNFDGGCGACATDDDGLLRGETA